MSSILLVTYFGTQKGGGIGTATTMLAEQLHKRGWQVAIAATEKFNIKGVSWYKLPKVRAIPHFQLRDKILENALQKIMEQRDFDLVQATDLRFVGRAAASAARQQSIPVIIDYRDYWFCCPKGDLLFKNNELCTGMESLNKCQDCLQANNLGLRKIWTTHKFNYFHRRLKALKTSQQNLPVSNCVTKKMNDFGLNQNQTVIFDTIIQPEKSEQKSNLARTRIRAQFSCTDKTVILFAGKFIYHRGIDSILKAAEILQLHNSNIHFLLVGDGEMRPIIEEFKQKSKLTNITIVGQIPNEQMNNYLAASDIFLFPSLLAEPFSRAVLEAVFAEKPVIASDLGGLKEVIRDGENGFLINPQDPQQIAEKITFLADNKNLIEKMGHNDAQQKNKWQPNIYFSKLEQVYEKLMKKNRDAN